MYNKKDYQLANEVGNHSLRENLTNLYSQFLDVLRISPGCVARREAEKRFTNDLQKISFQFHTIA